MKRKQKEGAPKTKHGEGLWTEGGLCNSFIELIASETSAMARGGDATICFLWPVIPGRRNASSQP